MPARTRRSLLRLLAGAATLKLPSVSPATVFQVDRLLARPAAAESDFSERRYRADAVITLLGLPIYSRAGVGGGTASLRIGRAGDMRLVSIEFSAGSFPDRARGLNRLGFIREVAVERGAGTAEAAYFGFMTSSPEENLDQAKSALKSGGEGLIPYTAIDGYAGGAVARARIARFHFPSRYSWSDCAELLGQVRKGFEGGRPEPRDVPLASPGAGAHTFLHAVLRALTAAAARSETPYVYNARQYRLETEKSPDERAKREFVSRRLCSSAAAVVRLRGLITEAASGRRTSFRIWVEETSGCLLPLRIEFQPRSFLRLAFEAEPGPQTHLARKEDS